MRSYSLTVFNSAGEKLLDEPFSAVNDKQAKKVSLTKLEEKQYTEYTYRCVSPDAKLILFHQ